MEKQDWSAEQQVWQRVRANREAAPQSDLRQLQQESMELAAAYRAISARLSGRLQELVKQLYVGEKPMPRHWQESGDFPGLAGERIKLWQADKEDPVKILEKCYHRSRRCMTEYLARSADGEFGVVFDRMAKREGEHCVLITEMLGSL